MAEPFTPFLLVWQKALIEGLKSEVTIQNDHAKKYFQIQPISYEDSVRNAIKEIEENQVISRWNDTANGVWEKK